MEWNDFKHKMPEMGSIITVAERIPDEPEFSFRYGVRIDESRISEFDSEDYYGSLWRYEMRVSDKIDNYGTKWCYSLIDQNDDRWDLYKKQRMERGFDESELWSLYSTIARFTLPRLVEFRNTKNCYPYGMTGNEWSDIIDKMIFSFTEIANDKKNQPKFDRNNMAPHNEYEDKIQEGLDLFGKHFLGLWY